MKFFKDLMKQNREIAKHIKSYAKPKDSSVNNANASAEAKVEKAKTEKQKEASTLLSEKVHLYNVMVLDGWLIEKFPLQELPPSHA